MNTSSVASKLAGASRMIIVLLALVFISSNAYTAVEPTISEINPLYGAVGSTIIIHGSNLSGTSHVFFGNLPIDNFKVVDPENVTAVVPDFPDRDSGIVEVWLIADGKQVTGKPFEFRPNLSPIH